MLNLLRIRNLALLDSVDIVFDRGLTVLSGESGSGKSMVLDALNLVAGAARPRLSVRAGMKSGFAEAEFVPPRDGSGRLLQEGLATCLEEEGFGEVVADPDTPIILARKLETGGRSRCFVQGQTVSRMVLGRIAAQLMEVCGQSEAHNLRHAAGQLESLDRFAGLMSDRRHLLELVEQLRGMQLLAHERNLRSAEAERRKDFILYQLSELDGLGIGEVAQKQLRKEQLAQLVRSIDAYREVLRVLGPEAGLLTELRRLSSRLESAKEEQLLDHLETALDHLLACQRHAEQQLGDEENLQLELDALDEDLGRLRALAAKHRVTVDQLEATARALEAELRALEAERESSDSFLCELKKRQSEALELATQLHHKRELALPRLLAKVTKELKHLGLGAAELRGHLSEGELTSTGTTQLELGFSANLGHPALPLSRVASGGELSRILLGFRLVTDSGAPVLLFDEIDAGAGGKTADKIAQSLKRASRSSQVIAITHWPQVAGMADCHLAVEKAVQEDTTRTLVTPLSYAQRATELARMLGGDPETARHHAYRLLGTAPAPSLGAGAVAAA